MAYLAREGLLQDGFNPSEEHSNTIQPTQEPETPIEFLKMADKRMANSSMIQIANDSQYVNEF